jgi:hypothetical protein
MTIYHQGEKMALPSYPKHHRRRCRFVRQLAQVRLRISSKRGAVAVKVISIQPTLAAGWLTAPLRFALQGALREQSTHNKSKRGYF